MPKLLLSSPETPPPPPPPVACSELVAVNILPAQRAVQIFYRTPFAIAPSEIVMPWATVKGMFLSMLQLELAEQGITVGLRAESAAS